MYKDQCVSRKRQVWEENNADKQDSDEECVEA